jgi:hypothetical protein
MFQYKMTQRPFGIGCQPEGARLLAEGTRSKNGYHAIIEYDAPLTDDEVHSFELKACVVTSYEVRDYVNARESVSTIEDAQDLAKQLASERGLPQYIHKVDRQKISVFHPED